MVALHFYNPAFGRAARAASRSQLFGKQRQCLSVQRQAVNQRDAFTPTAFCLQQHAHRAASFGLLGFCLDFYSLRLAYAVGNALAASWAHAACIR